MSSVWTAPSAEAAAAEVKRLRGYLLEQLSYEIAFGAGEWHELIAVLSPAPPDGAWQHFEDVAAPQDDGWYFWRDPDASDGRIHADQAIVEDGKIVGKHGCGLHWYSECSPLDMPPDVAEVLAREKPA